jgi:hypothetical protein
LKTMRQPLVHRPKSPLFWFVNHTSKNSESL